MFNRLIVWFAGLSPVSQKLLMLCAVGAIIWMFTLGFSLLKTIFIIIFVIGMVYLAWRNIS